MIRIRVAEQNLSATYTNMVQECQTKEMALEDAQHREKLVVQNINHAKRMVQEYSSDVIRMRSELSGLESDLTSAQQIEASSKVRWMGLKKETQAEKDRNESEKNIHQNDMEGGNGNDIERNEESLIGKSSRKRNLPSPNLAQSYRILEISEFLYGSHVSVQSNNSNSFIFC